MAARAAVAQRQGCGVGYLLGRTADLPVRVQDQEYQCCGRAFAPIEFTKDLSCPLLGLFGNEDRSPTPEQVDQHEAELKKHGKNYEFHRYDGAGHGFFYWHRPLYRPEQAMDGWSKVFAFFGKHLAK